MDAVTYLKEKARMTKVSKECIHCGLMCKDCPLSCQNNGTGFECSNFETLYPEKAVAIIEQWSKDHPRKTYLSDFLEKYPKAPFDSNHYPLELCPYHLGYVIECDCKGDCYGCWNTPMEDDK